MNDAEMYSLSRMGKCQLRSLFFTESNKHVRDFLRATVHGDEDTVLQMLTQHPMLLLERGHPEKGITTDYSGREYSGLTAFQLALCAGDEVMAKKMRDLYLAANPENGQAVLDAQFNEVFPNGYAAHLEEQKRSADVFLRDYLNPLVEAMTNAVPADLQAALDKRDNGSELCRKLREFKAAFHALSLQEKVYNPNHLLKTFEEYNAKFDAWYVNDNNPHRWLRLDLFWRQVIGWEERFMTTNYAQSFCTGLGNMVDNHQPLQRTLNLRNYDTKRDIHFFPVDADPSSKLGSDYGVYSYYGAGGWGLGWWGGAWAGRRLVSRVDFPFTKLMSSKNSKLGNIMQRESNHRAAPGCLVQ